MKAETKLVNLLIEKGFTIASAESCTGGLFCGTVINVSNASKVVRASIVTYSNQAKQKYCSVKEETINRFTVVSEEVAKEMACGISKECCANVGVGITGIAGPLGGTPSQPVGTVCFGFCINNKIYAYTKHFKGGRQKIRKLSVKFAIQTLINLLNE